MNILSEENIIASVYAFLVIGGLITFLGSLVVYLVKKSRKSKKR